MKVICGSKKSKSTRRFVMALMADPSLFCCFTSLLSLPAVFGHSQIIQIIVLIGAAENHRPPYGSQRMSSVQVYFPAMLTARNWESSCPQWFLLWPDVKVLSQSRQWQSHQPHCYLSCPLHFWSKFKSSPILLCVCMCVCVRDNMCNNICGHPNLALSIFSFLSDHQSCWLMGSADAFIFALWSVSAVWNEKKHPWKIYLYQ